MVQIDLARDELLTEHGLSVLEDRYLVEGETSPQQAFTRAAIAFADDEAHAQRLYDYVSRHWFMFATPVLSNGGTKRGLPISCFLNFVPDSRRGLNAHYDENAWLSSVGGGVGGYWGAVRSAGARTRHGSASSGIIPFMHIVDSQMLAFSQGVTRRGSYAAYLDISHPEIEEFIGMRKPAGGDTNRKNLNLHHGVNIPDRFMEIIEASMFDASADDSWPLVDPHSGKVVKVVSARALWEQLILTRLATGEPYIHFIDASNRALPAPLQKLGLKVHQSNLCTEIMLPTSEDRTAVCCLSSVNAEKFDEWKDHPRFIGDLVRMLDNVLTVFIDTVRESYPELEKAAYSAERERSLGLGLMGFHSYLQSKMIAIDSPMAVGLNKRMFRHLNEQAVIESQLLGLERGEAPDMAGTGMRNAHLIALAPNASSSIICGGTSPSIEPYRANAYMEKTLSGSKLAKNRHLETLLWSKVPEQFASAEEINEQGPAWVAAQWEQIVSDKGSVQNLECLSDWEKSVFKTAIEIDQMALIQLAADRQEFVCQGQSVNLFFPANASITEIHAAHFASWKRGMKSLYYLRSEAINRAENVSTKVAARSAMLAAVTDTCLACEG